MRFLRFLSFLGILILSASLAAPLAAAATDPFAQNTVLVTLKLLKTDGDAAPLPAQVKFPAGCALCESVEDPAYARQNAREIVLAMRLPKATPIQIGVNAPAARIRRVVLETTDLTYAATANGLSLTIPPQIADRVNSGELQTHLYWPGVELRFEHADPARRAGDYANGAFPLVERAAAANLEFGLLDAIGKLGLDHYVDEQNLGRLWLMGFDTNYPHGHRDYPAHMHMALLLPTYHGDSGLMPHYYLTPQGLISHALLGIIGWNSHQPSLDYTANQPFTPIDALGRPVFTLTITPEGWLNLQRPDGALCALRPVAGGFQSGVAVNCDGFAADTLQVEDDLGHAEIRETRNGKLASVYHYDPDTGSVRYP